MPRWDIFCRVIDNYGDIGVCWRLARQLTRELGQTVRLWLDDLAVLHQLSGAVDPSANVQHIHGIEIRRWTPDLSEAEPGDIVVAAFGVRLPDAYLQRMSARSPRRVWINLEYLSAEAWVDGCHGLPSPHPQLPLTQYFFFPGFTAATGGLLIEDGLASRRDAFQADAIARSAFWRSLGLEIDLTARDDAHRISLFCYDHPLLPALVEAWTNARRPVHCVVPAGRSLQGLAAIFGHTLASGEHRTQGMLTVHAIPFLDVDLYDRLLWACDLNFVRGEDSFVRAQLAARPLVWQAYPQDDDAHLPKAQAFVDRYCDLLGEQARTPLTLFFEAWNGKAGSPQAIQQLWPEFSAALPALARHARVWARHLLSGNNLALSLAKFCENKIK